MNIPQNSFRKNIYIGFIIFFSFIGTFRVLHALEPLKNEITALVSLSGAIICFAIIYNVSEKKNHAYAQTDHCSDFPCIRAPTIITIDPVQSKYVSLPTIHVDESI